MSLSGIKPENLTLLLQALKDSTKEKAKVDRDLRDTWSRIGKKESFGDMGFDSKEELEAWIENNPYANL